MIALSAATRFSRERSAMSDASVYVTSLRKNAEVDVNPQVFE